jgi:hypothetical protein
MQETEEQDVGLCACMRRQSRGVHAGSQSLSVLAGESVGTSGSDETRLAHRASQGIPLRWNKARHTVAKAQRRQGTAGIPQKTTLLYRCVLCKCVLCHQLRPTVSLPAVSSQFQSRNAASAVES